MKGDKSDTGWNESSPPERHDYSPPPTSAAAYIPPTRAPKESKYHTLDLKAVRLSPEIDPQRMKTQMALRRAPAAARATSSPSMWVSLCLAGAALGLGAWWCVQWWGEQSAAPSGRASTLVPSGLHSTSPVVVPKPGSSPGFP